MGQGTDPGTGTFMKTAEFQRNRQRDPIGTDELLNGTVRASLAWKPFPGGGEHTDDRTNGTGRGPVDGRGWGILEITDCDFKRLGRPTTIPPAGLHGTRSGDALRCSQ